MLEDRYKIIQCIENRERSSINYVSDVLINQFRQEFIKQDDEKLMNLVFAPNVSQADFDNFIKDWDIEVEGGHKALLLSYFMKMHPEINIPPYTKPRLNGLLQFYRFQNMKLISHFKKICSALKEANIDILILKGGAMKHLRPEFSRTMGDIDILVHTKDFNKSKKIVEKLGYWYEEYPHSVDLHKGESQEGILDIHHKIDMLTGVEERINNDLFERASKETVFGIKDIKVPSREDMVFIALVNLAKNLTLKHSSAGLLYTLFDCKFLIDSKPDFDWDVIKQNAVKTKTETKIFMAINFINRIVPTLLPENIKYNEFFAKEFKDYFILLVYDRFFISDLREKSHQLKIQNAIKNAKSFKSYLKFRLKYLWYKRKMIRKNPVFARKVLIKEKDLICE